jgi:hypothetical protein
MGVIERYGLLWMTTMALSSELPWHHRLVGHALPPDAARREPSVQDQSRPDTVPIPWRRGFEDRRIS